MITLPEKAPAPLGLQHPLDSPLENVFLQIMRQLSDEQKSPEEIARSIVERTAHLVKADVCTWFRVTSDHQKLILAAAYGTKKELIPTERIYDLRWDEQDDSRIDGLTAWIAVRGTEFAADSFIQLSAHKSHRGKWDEQVWGQRPLNELKSWLGVPLRLGEDSPPKESVIGVLKVERSISDPFTDHDKYVVRLMARYIAISLEYRNTLVKKFLQQVGHPLWAGLNQFKVLFHDGIDLCRVLLNLPHDAASKDLLLQMQHLLNAGKIQTDFINQGMRSVKELVLIQRKELAQTSRIKKDLVNMAKELVAQANEIALAQQVIYQGCRDFHVVFQNSSEAIQVSLQQGEYDALRMIITELLYNALKHGRAGGRAVLSLKCGEKGEVIVSVRDFGNGIVTDDLAHIFEEGFHKQASFAPEGMGFGLSFVRSVLQNLAWPLPEVRPQSPGVEFIIQIPPSLEV